MKKIIAIIIVILVSALFKAGYDIYSGYQRLNRENEKLQNNLEYYSALGKENIVLNHTISELKHSKDSIIQYADSISKLLKIKPKNIRSVIYTKTVLRDTLRDTALIPTDINFKTTVISNSETKIEVIRNNSILTVIPEISTKQTLLVYSTYRYKYSNFFKRLWKLNFKKIRTDRYEIHNSNDLIKVEDSRVINTLEK